MPPPIVKWVSPSKGACQDDDCEKRDVDVYLVKFRATRVYTWYCAECMEYDIYSGDVYRCRDGPGTRQRSCAADTSPTRRRAVSA